MQFINQSPGNSPRANRNEINIEENTTADLRVVNIKKRITEKQSLLNDLKSNPRFQNVLILMRESAVSDSLILEFLTGKASLEECFGKEKEKIDFLVKTYGGLEDRFGRGDSHFLSKWLATSLSTIFKTGYFESVDKTNSKMRILMEAVEDKIVSGLSTGTHRVSLLSEAAPTVMLEEINILNSKSEQQSQQRAFENKSDGYDLGFDAINEAPRESSDPQNNIIYSEASSQLITRSPVEEVIFSPHTTLNSSNTNIHYDMIEAKSAGTFTQEENGKNAEIFEDITDYDFSSSANTSVSRAEIVLPEVSADKVKIFKHPPDLRAPVANVEKIYEESTASVHDSFLGSDNNFLPTTPIFSANPVTAEPLARKDEALFIPEDSSPQPNPLSDTYNSRNSGNPARIGTDAKEKIFLSPTTMLFNPKNHKKLVYKGDIISGVPERTLPITPVLRVQKTGKETQKTGISSVEKK
ncbi:MAG: hypothetical protein K0R08_2206 [Solimicrobium sp.]|jgi:hypothetical protein|nr:hypothetical protein [Solimicrobium sp.]